MDATPLPATHPPQTGTGALLRWTLTMALLLAGGVALAWGMKWIGKVQGPTSADQAALDAPIDHHPTAIALGASLLAGGILFCMVHRRQHGPWRAEMLAFGSAVDAMHPVQRRVDLALASVLGLFLEVALIRWHGTEFRACAYLKNITLLACFLGLGLGFARARRPIVTFPIMLVLLAMQVLSMDLLSLADADRAVRNPLGHEIFWGMGGITNLLQLCVFYGFFAVLFISTIIIFIPIGQLTGRLMEPASPIASYTINIIGSILGVLLFALVSFLWLPPAIWFGLCALLALWLMRYSRKGLVAGGIVTAIMLAWLGHEPRPQVRNIYSPYQRLEVKTDNASLPDGVLVKQGVWVSANKTYYMQGMNLADDFVTKWKDHIQAVRHKSLWYSLPYKLMPHPEAVLIVGAGAGNDVAAAVRNGAKSIDAVEIDPAIRWIGQEYHPESPYQAGGVRPITNDARAFMKRSPSQRYDLIVFGLLDSHTLLSSMTSIRLDNFVYTLESMKDAQRLLRPGGLVCLSFAIPPDGHFSARLYKMLDLAFGHPPRTFGFEGQDTMFAIGLKPEDVRAGPGDPPETTPLVAASAAKLNPPPAEDDWPFPFLPGRTWSQFPRAYVYLIAMLVAISTVWVIGSAERGSTLSGHFFFLGGAFLLIETKGITELALVFGTTWVVSSVVILSILTLILLANWFVAIVKPRGVTIAYACLFASLIAGYFIPLHRLLEGNWMTAAVVSCALLCLPLFFAGIIFATSLKTAPSLPAAFASNLLGAILGGFCEYGSMVWGFRNLCLIGMALYVLSWLFVMNRSIAKPV